MTAQWIDSEPIPYTITLAGCSVVSASVTAREAARALGLSEAQVTRLAKRGDLTGAKIGGAWVLDLASVMDYPRRRTGWLAALSAQPRAVRRLDAGPLLAALAARGRSSAPTSGGSEGARARAP